MLLAVFENGRQGELQGVVEAMLLYCLLAAVDVSRVREAG